MSTTILTPEQFDAIWLQAIPDGTTGTEWRFQICRAIEAAFLQSEQVQAWKRDAERLDWLADQQAQIQTMVMRVTGKERHRIGWPDDAEYQCEWHPTAREAIDSAMERES